MTTTSLMATYKRLPVTFTRGEGVRLWDTEGRRYLDTIAGIAVCSLGHAHPAVTRAICDQASTLVHTSNLYGIPQQEQLGARLTSLSGMDAAFFCNSGAEANEAAIKLARLQGHKQGIENPTIVVMENSFHGRTLATLTATGNRKVQAGFEPLVKGFVRAPFDDIPALEAIASQNQDVVAVLVEPVQGEAGVILPADDYLNQIREICDRNNWLMMLDEIQTGMGRTGQWFAHQHNKIKPDVMTLAKALGNGVPIGACLAQGAAASLYAPGNHGSTFGGNPLACSAALAVIETFEQDALVAQSARQGERLLAALQSTLGELDGIKEIRGLGMMIGIEFQQPCTELVIQALDQQLLINVQAEKVIRLIPPLIMNDDEADELVEKLSHLIKEFLTQA